MADKSISELESEISRLKERLEKAQENERELERSRRAVFSVLEDLSESHTAVERAKREWEATFDGITDPIFIHDREFRIVRANRAYIKAAGMDFNDIIGRPYYEVFPKWEGPFKTCLEARESHEEDFSCPVTSREFKIRFYPLSDAKGGSLYSIHILEDVTEAKRAAERLRVEIEVTSNLLMMAEATAHTADMDKLMEQVARCSHGIMGCDACLSYLWDNEVGEFRPSQHYGLANELIPVFMTEPLDAKAGFVKGAMKKGGPVVIAGKKEDEELRNLEDEKKISTSQPLNFSTSAFSWIPGIDTVSVIPLTGKKMPLGLIVGVYVGAGLKPAPTIEDRDMKVMQGIMHQVSSALEEARLYKELVDRTMELSRKIETIQVMHDIDRSILSTLKSHEILETVIRMIAKVVPCERATVALVDRERKGFVFAAGFGIEFVPKWAFVAFEATDATEVIRTGRPQYAANLADIKGLLSFEKGLMKEGFLSHIRLPLMVKEEVAGILTVGAKRPSAFAPEDLSILEKMASQMGIALEHSRLIADLEELFLGTVKSLSSAIDAKSPWTAGHSERVTKYALDIGKEMGLSEKELKDLELAGLLHDVGKIGTFEAILDKPAKPTAEEYEIIKRHPVKGAEILSPIKQLRDIIPAIRHHHEFYDGTGYPGGLKGEEIPLSARILAVADTVDAMGADRPYRKGRPTDAIVAELRRCAGMQFDPGVVEAFLSVIGKREDLKMAAN